MAIITEDIRSFTRMVNIAEELDGDLLKDIGSEVVKKYGEDLIDHAQWIEDHEMIIDLATQKAKPKAWPWEKASNVILPMIAIAVINFSSTVSSEIIRNQKVAKQKVLGKDTNEEKQKRGERASKYLNFQLMEKMPEWQDETDKLFTRLALIGCCFRKIYYSPVKRRNVSSLVDPQDLVISKYNGDFAYAPRATHKFPLRYNDIIERQRSGVYLDIKFEKTTKDEETREFLEQHCWYDLDEDGYEEPYIITVDKKTKQIERIVARFGADDIRVNERDEIIGIRPINHFVKYVFLQPMDDSPYGDGFGKLLLHLNTIINSILNQLIDAGTLANVPGGLLGSGIRTDGGPFHVQPGEYQPVEVRGGTLAENIFTFPAKGPSPELFELLKLVIAFSQDLAKSKDIMSGEVPPNMPATTLLAALEQAHRTFSSIYRRIYRSLKKEINLIYDLIYALNDEAEYQEVLDDQEASLLSDFERKSFDVVPVASPEVSSNTQKMVRSQVMIDALAQPSATQAGIDARQVWMDFLEILGLEDIEKYLPPLPAPEDIPPSIDEQMLQLQAQVAEAKIQLEQQKLELKSAEIETKINTSMAELEAKIEKTITESIKNIALAEAAEIGSQLEIYKEQLATVRGDLDALKIPEVQEQKREQEREGGEETE